MTTIAARAAGPGLLSAVARTGISWLRLPGRSGLLLRRPRQPALRPRRRPGGPGGPVRPAPPGRPQPGIRLRLRRMPKRMLRNVRYPNLWIPRRDLLLPRRQFRAPQADRGDAASFVAVRQPQQPEAAAGTKNPSPAGARSRDWPLTAAATLGWMLLGLVLYACYLHISRSVPATADGASNALQAWAMLHGNPLLRGWMLSDVSFYTTELPQYLVIELVRGLTPDVMHIAGAMTYAFMVLLAARLAKGGATGLDGAARAGLTIAILVAPPQSSVYVLMLEPDHVGSTVPVLLMLLLLDRAGRKWFVPPLAFLLIGWALVADQVILYTAALPLAFVALARAYNAAVRKLRPPRTAWFELALAAAALAAVDAAGRALAMIKASGGFQMAPTPSLLAPFDQLPANLQQVVLGVLVLFGANFPGQQVSFIAAVALLHLVAVGLAAWATAAALRRFSAADVAVQVLAVAVVCSVVSYLLSQKAAAADSSREFAAVLPFGAALAGRVLAPRLRQSRILPALAAVAGLYAAGLVISVTKPPAPAQNQALASWLVTHKLTYGLADYWLANSTTVDSRGKVAVRAIRTGTPAQQAVPGPGVVVPFLWEAQPSWYSASLHTANFVVVPSTGPGPWVGAPSAGAMLRAFGQPAEVYFLANYTVLVWNFNLLGKLA
jgi:hypothetical protein